MLSNARYGLHVIGLLVLLMTPIDGRAAGGDERVGDMLYALERFGEADRARMLSWLAEVRLRRPAAGQLEGICRSPTRFDTYLSRLALLRSCLTPIAEGRAIVDHLLIEFHVNHVQAARRLDRCAAALLENGQASLGAVRAALPSLPRPPEARKIPLFVRGDELLARGRESLHRSRAIWECELDAAVEDLTRIDGFCSVSANLGLLGEVLLVRDRTPDDTGCAAVPLAATHASSRAGPGRAMAGLAAGLAGRPEDQRRLMESALAIAPIDPCVHLWCALAAGQDPSPGAADRFLAHFDALATLHRDSAFFGPLRRAAPCLGVLERGADVAMAMVAQGGRGGCAPELRRAWAAAVELDAAPLVAIALAARTVLPLDRANDILPGDGASLRSRLEQLKLAGAERERSWLTTAVVRH